MPRGTAQEDLKGRHERSRRVATMLQTKKYYWLSFLPKRVWQLAYPSEEGPQASFRDFSIWFSEDDSYKGRIKGQTAYLGSVQKILPRA
jgi:hypothetical protein